MAQERRSREQWRRLVEGWAGSGLTQAQYCERHRISVASLHRWREIFHRESGVGTVPGGAGADGPIRLLPVEVFGRAAPPDADGSALAVVLGDGLRVEVAPGFDAPTLARVVAVLRGRAQA
jgi:hypothetical protein